MDFNRVISLLKYDWMINRRNLRLFPIITLIIFVGLSLCFYAIHAESTGFTLNSSLATPIAHWVDGFFEIVSIGGIILITNILHMKFTDPRSSTSYLALPGSSTEKCIVMLLEYLIVCIAITILYLTCFYILMGIGYLCDPSSAWEQNALHYYFGWTNNQEIIRVANATENAIENNMTERQIKVTVNGSVYNFDKYAEFPVSSARMIKTAFFMAPFVQMCNVMYFIILNMYFRYNGILKSIGIQVFTFIVLIIGLMLCIIPLIQNLEEVDKAIDVLNIMVKSVTYLLYCAPLVLAAMLWFFHRQICRKQAK